MKRFQIFKAFMYSSEKSKLEKEAKFFFGSLESLMNSEVTSDDAIVKLKEAMSTLPQDKKKAYKATDTFIDYTNRFVDFFLLREESSDNNS